jgi:hypothetical protein
MRPHNADPDGFLDPEITAMIEEESTNPLAFWWLSFVDPSRPTGKQFLGACLIVSPGFVTAIYVSHILRCNPGGQVRGSGPIPIDTKIPSKFQARLLNREECDELDKVMKQQIN